MSGRIFFCPSDGSFSPLSSGEKRRKEEGKGKKNEKRESRKKAPRHPLCKGEAYGGEKNKVLENRKIFYFPVR